ncbi:unnamed protein product [Dicrocoelium dendriticum]|nr:unnamed protein product [Dicrocoelium dendriticum]
MVLPSFSDDSQWLSVSPSQSLLLSERSKAVLLDPLLSGYYHLFVGDLLLLEPVGNFDLFRLGSRWVAYVDVVGNIRTVYEMQKCYIIEVDDGTGCIECTVWRDTSCWKPPNISRHVVSSTSVEQERICDQLLRMARSQRPAHGNSPLRLGQMIHLRGRLGRYRGKVRLNATFSRIVTEPRELFSQMLHRKKLKSAIYSCPYDPEHIGKSLLKSLSVNCAETVLEDARRILLEDNLHTFTKWDLCLHSRLIQLLSTAPHPVAFDDAESPYLTTNSCVPERSLAQTVHRLVDGLIERLQSEGWIYPTDCVR